MEEQVGVADLVHTAVREQAAHVLFQLFTALERVFDASHQFFFLDGESIGIFGVEGWPVFVFQLVFLSFDADYSTSEVDVVE